ncbi:MAG: hypothetical protein ACPW61_00320 [Methyloligella sp. ZOD6]
MTKHIFLSVMLAAGLLFAGQTGEAQAAMATPGAGIAQSAVQGGLVQKAAWRCGPRRCHWMPGYVGPIPPHARSWGPPPRPVCVWKRGLLGRWKMDCDD